MYIRGDTFDEEESDRGVFRLVRRVRLDDAKRLQTLDERGIDFADVARFFFARSAFFRRMVVRDGETRWQAFGPFGDPARLVSVVYTERDHGVVCRIISVRMASDNERKEYHAAVQAG